MSLEYWNSENPDYSENEERLAKLTDHLLGNNFPGIDNDVKKSFSLYRYLVTHMNDPVEVLQQSIRENGKPMFSLDDIKKMVYTLQSQKHMSFPRYLVGQKGGAAVQPEPSKNLPKDGKPPVDETRNEFFDRVIRKMTANLPTLPRCFDGFVWFFFILYNLEQLEVVGPFLSIALDAITLSLPVMASITVNVIGKLAKLVPIPYVSLGGDFVGYSISLIFVTMAVFMNISRKHHGSAFKASLEAIPLVGDALFDAARSFEIGMNRYEKNKHKIVKTLDKVSPSTGEFVDYYTIDSEVHPGPMPTLTYEVVKSDVATYVKKVTGIDKVIDAIPEVPNVGALASKVTDLSGNATMGEKPGNATTGEKPGNATTGEKPGNATTGEKSGNATTGEKSGNATTNVKPVNATTGEKSGNATNSNKKTNLKLQEKNLQNINKSLNIASRNKTLKKNSPKK